MFSRRKRWISKAFFYLGILLIVLLSLYVFMSRQEGNLVSVENESVESSDESTLSSLNDESDPNVLHILSSSLTNPKTKKVLSTLEAKLLMETPIISLDHLIERNPEAMPALLREANRVQVVVSVCILQNLCEQDANPDLQFDRNHTMYHRLLNRALMLIRLIVDRKPSLGNQLDSFQLISNWEIPNQDVQINSLKLVLRQPPSDSLYQEILSRISWVKGEARFVFYEILQNRKITSVKRRKAFIRSISQALRKGDFITVYEIIRNLKKIKLSVQEFEDLVTQLCYIQETSELSHNWSAIVDYLKIYVKSRGFALSVDKICR